jgi:predicted acylesterase/phospholipase RssA
MHHEELRARRVGLVLAGGGAKGAYQIGCWKALRACGVDRFHAIAGSSVGAINAVFIGTGRFDVAERAWRTLRVRDVIGFSLKRILRLPLWLVAAIGSEFSPFKITRLSDRITDGATGWMHPVLCAAIAAGMWMLRGLAPGPLVTWMPFLAAIPAAAAALTLTHRFTRPLFLRPVFTDNAPLARTLDSVLSDADVRALAEAKCPIYGVLSQQTPGETRWGGWSPRYVRLDRAPDAAWLRRTLLDGSAVPGFIASGDADGRPVLDGAWTDNVPAGPLLFDGDHDLDVIFVIYLKPRVRLTPRHNSLCGLVLLLLRDAIESLRPKPDIRAWAATRWTAACAGRTAVAPARPGRRPLIVSVSPSQRVGNFFSGTLWFSRAKSASLIELGERDMFAALQRLPDLVDAPAGVTSANRRRRGTRAAVRQPGPALPGPRTPPALWPSPEFEAVESGSRT